MPNTPRLIRTVLDPDPLSTLYTGRLDGAGRAPVTVYVTCHNYGRFLAQCLDSLTAQTLTPARIVCIDDASTDDTATVAAQYAPNVEYRRVNFCDLGSVKNHCLADAETPWCLFVDADNWLAAAYISALWQGAQLNAPRLAFVYPMAQEFGDSDRALSAAPFDSAALRRMNFADNCSLLSVQAARAVGGFDAAPTGPYEDWGLYLRLTARGYVGSACPDALLHYRVHGAQRSQTAQGSGIGKMLARNATVTLLTLFCGRAWQLDRYFAFLDSLECFAPHLELFALDNSGSRTFGRRLRARLGKQTRFRTRYAQDDSRADPARKLSNAAYAEGGRDTRAQRDAAVHSHLAAAYGAAFAAISTDFVFCVEDDVIPPPDALKRLFDGFDDPQAGAVGAPVVSRQHGDVMAFPPPNGEGLQPAERVAAACCLYRRAALADCLPRFLSPLQTGQPSPLWWDVSVCEDMTRAGWRVLLCPSVRPAHFEQSGTAVTFTPASASSGDFPSYGYSY